jgi:phosphodiesterase/alkaline phosphatase D-like protein
MEKLSRTVTFTIDQWQADAAQRYQVRFDWRGQQYVWEGKVRREPESGEQLKLGCFSCDNGYLFPIPAMVRQVQQQDPDMLFFAGDQIYESYGGFGVARRADTETAMIDYLRKYYQFGWTWRDLLRDRPSVIVPDDHDVFQGNLWGHGGRKLPEQAKQKDWTWGGYVMPGDWVAAVERTQVGHLPDPAVDMQLPIGIKPYFTKMTYGGVGFAVLEDRKFKTGPKSLPEAQRVDGQGADLLGPQQEAFLKQWAADWTGQEMKCALSQTIFCTAATHSGPKLKRSRGFFDSGAWPQAARDRAVRILGDCNALAIHGDQHLGILLRHGIDDFDDAGYAFMVPGTANGFPRAWWPGVDKELPQPGQDFTGRFHDDAGHPIHVLAVGNPEPGSNLLPKSENPMEIGYRKGSGYGLVEFNKKDATATISMYRLGESNELFSGFPKTIRIGGKPRQP